VIRYAGCVLRRASWAAMRSRFVPGAAFVDPVQPPTAPRAIDLETFVAQFRQWVEGTPKGRAGFRERIVVARIDAFGHIAHAYATFEGFAPGQAVAERVVDSIQLVFDDTAWKVASFTTQYEAPGLPMPARFRAAR